MSGLVARASIALFAAVALASGAVAQRSDYEFGGPSTPFPTVPGAAALMQGCRAEILQSANFMSTIAEWPENWRDFMAKASEFALSPSVSGLRSFYARFKDPNSARMAAGYLCMAEARIRQLGGSVDDIRVSTGFPTASAAPAPGVGQAELDLCLTEASGNADARITACTAVLGAPAAFTPKTRPVVLAKRGYLYHIKDDLPRARADLDASIAIDATDANAWFYRSYVRRAQGDLAGATADTEQVVALAPKAALAWATLGSDYENARQYPRSIDAYGKAIAIEGGHADWLNSRCWVRAISGSELAAALAECNASIAIKADPNTYDSRGLVKLRMGDFAGAAADYDTAVRGDPTMASSLYGRGVAKVWLNQVTAGLADVAAALQKDPTLKAKYAERGVMPVDTPEVIATTRPPAPVVRAPVAPAPVVRPPAAAGGVSDMLGVDSLINCFVLNTKPRLIDPRKATPAYEFDITNRCALEGGFAYLAKIPGVQGSSINGTGTLAPGATASFKKYAQEGLEVQILYACPTKAALQPRYRRKIAWAGDEVAAGSKLYYCKLQFEHAPTGVAH
ncbi:hypothetical protein BH09PSE4_BH09PSE4_07460 [soil metagenome]